MSRLKIVQAIGAGLAALGVVLALWPARRSEAPESPPETAISDRPPAFAARPALRRGDSPAGSDPEVGRSGDAIAAALAPLPPEDAEWVLDEAERYRAARAMDEQAMAELVAQLASVRMHAVIERTEPMMPREPGAP